MNEYNIPIRSILHCNRLLFIFGIVLLLSTTMASILKENHIVKSNNQFGMDLFKIVAKDDANKLISPFSAHVVISMAYQGADGKTAKNMASVFHLPNAETTANEYHKVVSQLNKVTNVTLDIANKIYIKEKFNLNPEFKQIIETKFLAEAEEIEFSQKQKAAAEINEWVENKTNKKITELIKPDMLDDSTRLVLLNAVYFKGNWAKKFDVSNTQKKPFHLLNGEEIQVDMMYKSSKFGYTENEDLKCKILELPYEGNELSMVIFLPNERNGITQLQEQLDSVNFASTLQGLRQITVNVELPKFKIESTIPMKDALIELGAGQMFSDGANFLKMADEGLKVSDVIQKTFIEVNEEGAEAAAATGLLMRKKRSLLPETVYDFIANRPFVFSLVHKSSNCYESALFLGRVGWLASATPGKTTHDEF